MASKRATRESDKSLYLLVTEETSSGFGERFYKQVARVVTQRYESGTGYVPYGPDDSYGTVSDPLWSGLRFGCQGDSKSRLRTDGAEAVYGYGSHSDVEYAEPFRVTLGDARRMVKTIEKIQKNLERLTYKRGYVRSWGEWLGRLAEAIGCIGIGFTRTATAYERTGEKYVWKTVGEGVNEANNRVWQWQREGREAAGLVEQREQPAAAESEAS